MTMNTTCPHCGAGNSLLRIFLYWTGFHLRCRSCRRVYRLIETVSGIFVVIALFGVAYLPAFYGMTFVPAPKHWGPSWALAWLAVTPAIPGAVAAVGAIAWLHRRGPPVDGEHEQLSSWSYAFAYWTATIAVVAVVGLVAAGILAARFGERLPEASLAEIENRIELSAEQAEAFVFVDLKGVSRNLAELRGSPVFLHSFALGDPAAKAGLETIRQLRKTAVDDDFVFVIVVRTDFDSLREFARTGAPTLPYTWTEAAWPDAFGDPPAGSTITVVLDRAGRLAAMHVGAADWATEHVRGVLNEISRR